MHLPSCSSHGDHVNPVHTLKVGVAEGHNSFISSEWHELAARP